MNYKRSEIKEFFDELLIMKKITPEGMKRVIEFFELDVERRSCDCCDKEYTRKETGYCRYCNWNVCDLCSCLKCAWGCAHSKNACTHDGETNIFEM